MTKLIEIRWHGRGGQGAVTAGKVLAESAMDAGLYFQAFPEYGPARMGAPIQAFTRISDRAIRTRSQIYHPTTIIVLDDSLLDVVNITDGAQDGAILLINTRKSKAQLKKVPDNLNVATVDATAIAREHIGVAIVNTAMLGALVGVTGIVSLDSVKKAIASTLPQRIVERNVAAAEAACRKVKGK